MLLTNGVHEYHDMNAIMKPNVEKKKVRPYKLNGFNTGTDCALWFIGLTCGARHKTEIFIVKLGLYPNRFSMVANRQSVT